MLKKPLFLDLFLVICLIAVLHQIGIDLYLYWIIPFYDIPMHILGGFWIGLVSLWIYFISGWVDLFKHNKKAMLFSAFMTVLVIGLGWEVFEYMVGITTSGSYWDSLDTFKDLCDDVIGAGLSFLYVQYRLKKIK